MSEKIFRSAALRAAEKKLPILGDKRLNDNLDMAAGDMAEAYRIGAAEAQAVIVARLQVVKAVPR